MHGYQYEAPVHYHDEDGNWIMYDNRFKQADIATETKFAVTAPETQTATEGTIVSTELVSDTGGCYLLLLTVIRNM